MSDCAPVMLVGVRDGERDGEDRLCEWNGWVGGLGGKVALGEGKVGTDDDGLTGGLVVGGPIGGDVPRVGKILRLR